MNKLILVVVLVVGVVCMGLVAQGLFTYRVTEHRDYTYKGVLYEGCEYVASYDQPRFSSAPDQLICYRPKGIDRVPAFVVENDVVTEIYM